METQAAILECTNRPLKIMKLTLPALKRGQVLVKIVYTGLCHSQLNEIQGKRGEDKFLPHTLGHEASGIVLKVGPDVTKVKQGDHVVISWLKGLGIDVPSTQYYCGSATVNSGAVSTFMQQAVISENRIIPIDKEIPLREAALLGCALPTGMGIVFNCMQAKPGKTVAIFGMGGIGMSALIATSLIHSSKIIAIDLFSQKLEIAKKMGATHLINASTTNSVEEIAKITEGQGVDFSIEATGSKSAMEAAFQSVKNQTGLCIIAGNLSHDQTIEINPFELILGKKIIGTWGGASQIDQDVRLYSDFIKNKKINLAPLITSEFSLFEINEAVDLLKSGKIIRALIKMD